MTHINNKNRMNFLEENFSSYTIIKIEPTCYETYPCQHKVEVKFNNDNINVVLTGTTIANYYKFNKFEIPLHFNEYISYHSGLN